MSERLGCCIPGCRRTIAARRLGVYADEWICAKHWLAIPKSMRRRYARLKRRANTKREPRCIGLASWQWSRCVDRATAEAFMGVQP